MNTEPGKVACTNRNCGWRGTTDQLLRAPNPFDPDDEMTACPSCRDVGSTEALCDEPGCREHATCGWQSPTGYRWTCGNHMRPKEAPRG